MPDLNKMFGFTENQQIKYVKKTTEVTNHSITALCTLKLSLLRVKDTSQLSFYS